MKKRPWFFWIIIILALAGVLTDLLFSRGSLLRNLMIPVLVFVVVLLLYRYLPNRFRKQGQRNKIKIKPSVRTMEKVNAGKRTQTSTNKRKSYPFQVIEGSKGKNDDQQPKYH
ncbi:SA1362 family protein [Paenibacillus pini]|uniref:Uncharacterized protein n=1 Tax=Paenibacillus pini JCM 16418 TaxID=1236976 RepID=W7Z375_9BACL|nr:SA1362 family protein [Paenibacillus pini]GAF08919.1 hypothetical protein JCM16418_3030 [Paenibacillus pini JCM 16418]